jgi:hypothetical protein
MSLFIFIKKKVNLRPECSTDARGKGVVGLDNGHFFSRLYGTTQKKKKILVGEITKPSASVDLEISLVSNLNGR